MMLKFAKNELDFGKPASVSLVGAVQVNNIFIFIG